MAEANARIARVDAWLIPGLGRTIAITNANGTNWPADTFVHFGPLSATTGEVVPTIAAVTAAVVGPVATVTLTEANVAAIRTAYPSSGVARCPWHIRTGSGAGEVAHATGYLGWDLTGSAQSATAVATVVVGPPGSTGPSAYDAAVAGGYTGTAEEWAAGLAGDRMAAVAAADRAEAAENTARGLVTSSVRASYDPTADDEILTLSIPTGMLDPDDALILLLPVEA